jgi:hypothetical protein
MQTRTPLTATVHPIRHRLLAHHHACLSPPPITQVARSLPSHTFMLVVLAPPITHAARPANPSLVLVALVLARVASAGC